MLGGFVDTLLQAVENRRPGLSDEALEAGEKAVQPFFVELYKGEVAQLEEAVAADVMLGPAAKKEFSVKVDELIRKVVIPAYVRVTTHFARRERNDFYLTPARLHGLERLCWGGVGVALGAFAVWAPFIPIWEKEWILPFAIVGLFFPNVRRLVAIRGYQRDLNSIVGRTDDEIWRMNVAYLTKAETAVKSDEATGAAVQEEPTAPARHGEGPSRRNGKLGQGGR